MGSVMRRVSSTLAVTLMLGIGTVVAQQSPGKWVTDKYAKLPQPSEEYTNVVLNNVLYLIGGNSAVLTPGARSMHPARVLAYDLAGDKWTKKKPIPVRVHHQAQAGYNGKLYILGGCTRAISGEGGTTNAWEYDPAADAYKALAAIPGKRCSAQAEEVGGKIYLIGGLEPLENGMGTRVTGRNQMYDPATNTWTERSPMPTARNHAFSGVVNGKIYVIGGRIGAGNIPATTNIDVVEEYDPATNLWGVVKQRMPTPRSGGGAATYNGKIFVSGGELQNRQMSAAFRALEAYDPLNDTWEILPSMPSARHGDAAGFIGNKLHLVSGKQEGGGAPDMAANSPHPFATEAHDVLEIPSGTQ